MVEGLNTLSFTDHMNVAENLNQVLAKIADACERSGRNADDVKLIAVSKTWPAEHVQKAVDAGQLLFGENKLQEGEAKIPNMSQGLTWHFIGGLQSNKVRKVLSLFHMIHSIDRLKLAQRVSTVAVDMGVRASVLLQVNVGDEASKGGFSHGQIREQLAEILKMPNLKVQGLMCIPPAAQTPEDARRWFVALRRLRDELEQQESIKLPELSMGMSGDYEVAVEEGATMVRVGSSIFGHRNYEID